MANTRKTLERVPDEEGSPGSHTRKIDANGEPCGTWNLQLGHSDDYARFVRLAPAPASEDSELSQPKMCWRNLMRTSPATPQRDCRASAPTYSSLDAMSNGNTILTMRKSQCCAASVMSHMIHHRGTTRRVPAIERHTCAVNLRSSSGREPFRIINLRTAGT